MLLERLLTEQQYAELRGVTIRTLQRERALRIGAPYIKAGKQVFYRPEKIEEWLLSNEHEPLRSKAKQRANEAA